jgi:hypothetical protein
MMEVEEEATVVVAPAKEDWVDTHQASKITGFTYGTLRTWRCQKKGPPFSKVGSAIRYKVGDLQDYMEDRIC